MLQNASFNEIIAQGESRTKTFTKAEAMPMPVNCNIHPFMEAHILVQDHPYMAVSGEDGTFEIKNLPAGKHNFVFWHESGYVRNAQSRSRKDRSARPRGLDDSGQW